MFARDLKQLSEIAEKAKSGVKERGDMAACIYLMGKARTNWQYEQTLEIFQVLHLGAAEWFDKGNTLLLAMFP